jgi:hypothetical protein
MARLRRRFSLARLMLAVLILAVNFAWLSRSGLPIGVVFSAGLAFSGGLIVPLFVTGLSLIEVITIVAIGLVLGALFLPAVTPDHSYRRRTAPPTAAAGPGPGPGVTPGGATPAPDDPLP